MASLKSRLFATQSGPIVLVQVENELPATDKTYVEWCGTMAHAALEGTIADCALLARDVHEGHHVVARELHDGNTPVGLGGRRTG